MASRALAFSDPEVIRLATERFVPVAENCSHLQRQQDARGDLFRLVAEQGHYGGRVRPSETRQGQYAAAPDGRLLASINTRDAKNMLRMMHAALERWEGLSAADRAPADAPPTPEARHRPRPPEGGVVLRVTARDLPRAPGAASPDDWRSRAANYDHAWFTADEAAALVPDPAVPGASHEAPAGLARRLARFHCVDIVRGETPMWRSEQIECAQLTVTVAAVDAEGVDLTLDGRFRAATEGTWAIRPFGPHHEGLRRGADVRLLGRARWDPVAQRFATFRALAAGPRWGGTEHNLRWDDLDPAPVAFLFELADGTAPGDGTPPQGVHGAYWRG